MAGEVFQISPRILSVLIFGAGFAEKAQHFFARVCFLGHTDDFERSSHFSSDFHETFVYILDGSVKNDFSLETDSHILDAINTGEFRPLSLRNAFVEGMLAFKRRMGLSPRLIKLSKFVTCECFFQVIRGAVDQSSDFVQLMREGTRCFDKIKLTNYTQKTGET